MSDTGIAACRRLRIVRGDPTAEEIAAVVTVLAARTADQSAPAAAAPDRSSAWLDRAVLCGAPSRPGPHGWRRSARPR
ncbi:MAG: acyl-CoA carboxylase subunit epsilon [Mycobacteriales bacterium]